MKTPTLFLTLLVLAATATPALGAAPTRDLVAELRAFAAEHARVDIRMAEETVYKTTVLSTLGGDHAPNCMTTAMSSQWANADNAVNLATLDQCTYQLHSGPAGLAMIVAGGIGIADVYNYGAQFGYRVASCAPVGASTPQAMTIQCVTYHSGIPLSQFTLWDGMVSSSTGATTTVVWK